MIANERARLAGLFARTYCDKGDLCDETDIDVAIEVMNRLRQFDVSDIDPGATCQRLVNIIGLMIGRSSCDSEMSIVAGVEAYNDKYAMFYHVGQGITEAETYIRMIMKQWSVMPTTQVGEFFGYVCVLLFVELMEYERAYTYLQRESMAIEDNE